jgi:formate dehydrogenase iron-sulfur subunit
MCYEKRLRHDQQPACTEACPTGATKFGTRRELLAEAHQRLSEHPEKYVNAVVGETEIGGTSVLYISDVKLDFLAFKPDLGNEPLPQRTWEVLSKIPLEALGVGGAMAALWWIIGRRNKLAQEAAHPATPIKPSASSEEKNMA